MANKWTKHVVSKPQNVNLTIEILNNNPIYTTYILIGLGSMSKIDPTPN